jgi:chemotaxis protein histidine kinase CheA
MSPRVPSPEALAALAALRARFRASLEPTLAAFDRHADALAEAPASAAAREGLQRELHRVRGTAGSYGYAEASALCAGLEARVREWADDPALERAERAATVRHFAAALRRALEERDALGG